MIIPKGHLSTPLACDAHISLKHTGVNFMVISLWDPYWLVGVGSVCKRVKHMFMPCRRQNAQCGEQVMAFLPQLRVNPAPPFAIFLGWTMPTKCFVAIALGKNSTSSCLHVQ